MGPTVVKCIGLKLEAAREYATAHGIAFNGDLLDRIELCEAWKLAEDERREKQRETQRPPAEEEPVN